MNDKSKFSSLNKLAKLKQRKVLFLTLIGIFGLSIIGYAFIPHKASHQTIEKSKTHEKVPDMTGVLSNDFTNEWTKSAQEKEQTQIDGMQKEIQELKRVITDLKKENDGLKALPSDQTNVRILDLEKKLSLLQEEKNERNKTALPSSINRNAGYTEALPQNAGDQPSAASPAMGIHDIAFVDESSEKTTYIKEKTPDNYVPAGTFVKAVMLGGADANASVNGQSDTSPILFRILDQGTLPNGKQSHLKGCFVLAAVYGDISSERGEIRLQNISCTRRNNSILDIPIEGTVFDIGGKNGVRGTAVMRNGQILMWAGLSGMMSGIGSAMQQTMTTQSISPLGATETVAPSKVFAYGAYGGAGTALSKLSDYYIKRADQYHPVIEVGAGTVVDIVFQKGFILNPNQMVAAKELVPTQMRDSLNTNHDSNQSNDSLPKDLLEKIQDKHLGDELTAN